MVPNEPFQKKVLVLWDKYSQVFLLVSSRLGQSRTNKGIEPVLGKMACPFFNANCLFAWNPC